MSKINQEFVDSIGGDHMLIRCALRPRYPINYMENIMGMIKPKTVLEIGTFNGIMALYFAKQDCVEHVTTIDIAERLECSKMWNKLRVASKIQYLIVEDNDAKTEHINSLKEPIDLVFIDGDHSYQGVKLDFELTTGIAKYILFHDYGSHEGVTKFIDEQYNIIQKRDDLGFALWKKQ